MLPVVFCLGLFFLSVSTVGAQWDASRFAWYSEAGANFASGLPIGNGRLGATVLGSAVEKIILNENSVWSGPLQQRTNPNAKAALAGIRQKLQAGDITGAGQSAMSNMAGNPTSPRAYHPLVNMGLDFGHGTGISSYNRRLDTFQGTATVSYVYGGVNYRSVWLSRSRELALIMTTAAST